MGFRDILALRKFRQKAKAMADGINHIPDPDFKKAANDLLTAKEKYKISAPNHDEMKKEFIAGFDEWKKTHPEGSEWQYAKEFMQGKIHD